MSRARRELLLAVELPRSRDGRNFGGDRCRECPESRCRLHQANPKSVSRRGNCMYGHSHTGIGALILTLVAVAKGGIGYLVRHMSSKHW
jgi:hypothetical protein